MGYNNVQFTGGNAVVDYNTSSFALPTTDGRFTLTGIPTEHNGKHAILVGAYGTPTPTALYGLEDATSLNVWKGIPIKDGTAEIRLFKLTTGDQQFSRFGEAADNATLVIIIQDDDDFNLEHYQANQMTYPHLVYTSVDFVSGKANKPFNEGTKVGGL